ncbi:5-carboxymethyl-2-hydroxymuconate Delta-isomerase [Shewanella cyperi]|uniref:5-carboxymethyl-2-hydroxymuconate Delta-isomerase n=1 Tax=Shewanella cyperi TaxID=2814292 RepID=UPI001A93D459|nr:5-carboxymethyl-2-hydroxymuconate Delta-isomerase [Shewanella cyperi]QSX42202.1 5-carboxymethyl-2-hydroxymuconate Delta-isomerase [Shewanella cyperi]
MPHCVIEYSANALAADQVTALTDAAHGVMLSCGLFEPASVKSRAIKLEHFRLGEQDGSFVHISIAIMPGRSEGQKQALLQAMDEALAPWLGDCNSLTMEVVELVQSAYFKRLRP